MKAPRTEPVAVVGAGPVGLTAALVLARAGIPVTVYETQPALSTASRASTFHPSTLDLLRELGVAAELHRLGRVVDRIQWRDLDGHVHAELDYRVLAGTTGHPHRLHVEQSRLTPLLLDALRDTGRATLHFGAPVTAARRTRGAVELTAGDTGHGRVAHTGRYAHVVAADGSRSTLRGLAGLPAATRAYPHYALRIVTREPLDATVPGLAPLSYVRDARASYSVLGMPDHWRLIFRIPQDVPRDEVVTPEAVRALLTRALPGVGADLPVADAHTYRLVSSVLPRYRAGRLLFIGDAAHLTSTAGGMNMNCGLHDAVAVGRALVDVHTGRAPDTALTAALELRRTVVSSSVIPRSEARTAGIDDAGALERALADVRRTAADPESALAYLTTASLLDCAPRPLSRPTGPGSPRTTEEPHAPTPTATAVKDEAHEDLVSQTHR
ncbi:FAD-dependent monooxygenase [Streptomyces sp. NBC_01335]|uniref:FAD-dependent oxidoreductase n=1 Tax=Streptomyces sp. NBC_01335 TaxID=2903828 RepID=UPI002E14A6AD|nr:FAD-dependent monooxygenase [Streptomyces sp. NBC_01335]